MIRTLLADDQELVRSGFQLILESQPDIQVIGEASDGLQAVTACRDLEPDVILLDIRMPVMDGIEATKRIVATNATKVLILTTFDLDELVYDAFNAGASGFLLKDVRRTDLIHAVRSVASGDTLVAPAITRRLVEQFTKTPPPGRKSEALRALTDRQTEILALIGQGMSNAEIAASLVLSEATIKTHVSAILTRLNLRDRVHAVVLAHQHGLTRTRG